MDQLAGPFRTEPEQPPDYTLAWTRVKGRSGIASRLRSQAGRGTVGLWLLFPLLKLLHAPMWLGLTALGFLGVWICLVGVAFAVEPVYSPRCPRCRKRFAGPWPAGLAFDHVRSCANCGLPKWAKHPPLGEVKPVPELPPHR